MNRFILIFTVVCAACNRLPVTQQSPVTSGPTFQLMEGDFGRPAKVVLRMNTTTGETWWLVTEPYRWIGVEDELQRAGKYNSQTKKIEWGVQLPDGRDLNELSKEELVRALAAAIRNGQTPNPKDPVGLFEPPATKPAKP